MSQPANIVAQLMVEPEVRNQEHLHDCVRHAIENYFEHLNGHAPTDLYQMVLSEVEKPLLETVMQFTDGNQTHAAEVLGMSRSTLRKKLSEHHLT